MARRRKKLAKRQPKATRTQSFSDVCEELDLSERTLREYLAAGAPSTKQGPGKPSLLDSTEIAAWMAANGKTGERGRPPEKLSPTLEEARLRKEAAMAENWELRNKQILGETVEKEEYRRLWMTEVATIKGKCRGLGASVAPQCVGQDAADIQSIIDGRVEQIFRELSE